ncbi:MAG: NTP transferase domain-containing protein [Syntrophomonadaceae bacterium]|nr:NTP transferase domain-containing protein [Syntrophomonadaceae bacterium]
MAEYDAVILAGGVNSGQLKQYAPYDNEALIIIGSYPMIYYVYKAVRSSGKIRNIVISGPRQSLEEIFKKEQRLYFAAPGEDAIDSFANAREVLQQVGSTEKILVLPTDIPLITTAAIDDFLERCEGSEADFCYSIVGREVNEARFPGVRRTYVRIREGVFTGGNLFIVKAGVVDNCLEMAKKLVAKRKSPLALARLFGIGLAWKYLVRRLAIPDIEARFYEVLGIRGRAVISPYAEVGVDVDKPSDLKLAEKYLGTTLPS